jgi:hypothetical protein
MLNAIAKFKVSGGAVTIFDNGTVMCEDKNGMTDWPIMLTDGTVTYDWPSRYNAAVKTMVRRALVAREDRHAL